MSKGNPAIPELGGSGSTGRRDSEAGCSSPDSTATAEPTQTGIAYARGSAKYDNEPEPRFAESFDQFLDDVLADRSTAKGRQFICAAFNEGEHRNPDKYPGVKQWRQAALARPRRFLPLDVDGMAEPAVLSELVLLLHQYRGAAYTTASHAPDAPRCRVILELSRATDRDEGEQLGYAFQAMLEAEIGEGRVTFDPTVYRAEQPCYCPPTDADVYRFSEGSSVDVDAVLAEYVSESTSRTTSATERTGHADWLADLTRGDDLHTSACRLVARWVAKGWSDAEIRATLPPLLNQAADIREADRIAEVQGDELERMIQGAREKGFAPRDYAEIIADAKAMDKDTDPGDVEALVVEAAALSPARERKVWEAIKAATGLPFSTLKAAKRTEGADDESDHLTLARSVVQALGRENVIGTQAHVWTYSGGIWRPLEPRGEKHVVQSHLDAEHDGEAITRTLVEGVTDVFRTEVYRPSHEWNVGPEDAICTPTGELVLVDGVWELQAHNREHYRTTRIPVEYDPEATAPRFLQFLDEVFEGDPDAQEKADAILEMIGYTLMAHNRYERFAILVGIGANGKSVLLAMIEALLGAENVAGVQPAHFDRSFQRAHLHLKLANIVTEIREGEVIADAELKSITSGEATTVEHKFRDPFVLKPYATCWFGTNHMPHTRDFSAALFRRAIVVPFNNVFETGHNRDPNLKHKLFAELPGILNMALTAYAGVVRRGDFTEPESCIEAKREWRLNADQAAQFVEECCNTGRGQVGSRVLYKAYEGWAEGAGIRHTLTEKTFSERIEKLGYHKEVTRTGRVFHGLTLVSSAGEYRAACDGL